MNCYNSVTILVIVMICVTIGVMVVDNSFSFENYLMS